MFTKLQLPLLVYCLLQDRRKRCGIAVVPAPKICRERERKGREGRKEREKRGERKERGEKGKKGRGEERKRDRHIMATNTPLELSKIIS